MPLAPATRDDTAWVSILAQRTRAGIGRLPGRYEFPQIACRTYVVPEGPTETTYERDRSVDHPTEDAVGVFFLRVATPSRLATLGGQVVFGIPYVRAPVELQRTADSVRVRTESPAGTVWFDASLSTGDPTPAEPDSLVAWLTERYRYYRPDGRVGVIDHDPWRLGTAAGTVHKRGPLAGVDVEQAGEPVVRYSPGTEVRLTKRA